MSWMGPTPSLVEMERWVLLVAELKACRYHRHQHDQAATALRRARMALFQGKELDVPTHGRAPSGPPLPTRIEEVESLRDARTRFERAHIQAVLRDQPSLREASAALGISYSSLWRRLK
ncbi:MAG: hypothetical protein HC923_07100 [Myxococcales bacterium]|nr:hypothetical protein [Myxococcales bacterium]